MNEQLVQIRQEIDEIKRELASLSTLRPGSICRQYRHPQEQESPYYQLSYTHRGQSRTEHVSEDELTVVEAQLATYRRLKRLVERWIELGIAECRLLRTEHRARNRRPS